jgi:C4-dicarboxylate transporter DctQ subunit
MPGWLGPLERFIVRFENIFGAIGMGLLVATGALICVDVLLRYGFGRPIMGSTEIIEYTLVYITFLGASWAVPRHAHIDIDVAVQAMPKSWQRVCATLSSLVSLAVALVLTVFGAATTWVAFERHSYRPTMLEIPLWIVLVIIPIGSALLSLRFLHETMVRADAVIAGSDLQRSELAPPTVD